MLLKKLKNFVCTRETSVEQEHIIQMCIKKKLKSTSMAQNVTLAAIIQSSQHSTNSPIYSDTLAAITTLQKIITIRTNNKDQRNAQENLKNKKKYGCGIDSRTSTAVP